MYDEVMSGRLCSKPWTGLVPRLLEHHRIRKYDDELTLVFMSSTALGLRGLGWWVYSGRGVRHKKLQYQAFGGLCSGLGEQRGGSTSRTIRTRSTLRIRRWRNHFVMCHPCAVCCIWSPYNINLVQKPLNPSNQPTEAKPIHRFVKVMVAK